MPARDYVAITMKRLHGGETHGMIVIAARNTLVAEGIREDLTRLSEEIAKLIEARRRPFRESLFTPGQLHKAEIPSHPVLYGHD